MSKNFSARKTQAAIRTVSHKLIPLLVLALTVSTSALPTHAASGKGSASSQSADPDADYDRLDGTGKSGKRVNVIEWEGNLEVHVYPKGSLKGLALKLDKRNKNKPVMVIGYRFDTQPKEQLIRRAILGIELHEGFKTYRDPSEHEFDKIIISNNGLSAGNVVAYRLEPEPTQLYPEGHPALAKTLPDEKRQPASEGHEEPLVPKFDEETGSIQPFFMKSHSSESAREKLIERSMNRR